MLQEGDGGEECLLDRVPNNSPMRRVLQNLNQLWWWEARGDFTRGGGAQQKREEVKAKTWGEGCAPHC